MNAAPLISKHLSLLITDEAIPLLDYIMLTRGDVKTKWI